MSFLNGVSRTGGAARLVLTGGLRLGRSKGWLPPEQREGALLERRLAFGAVVNYAIANRAHGLVIAGGLFDRSDPEPAEIAAAAAGLQALGKAGISSFAIHGPYELPPSGALSALDLLSQLGFVECLDRTPNAHLVSLGGLRLAFSSLPGAGAVSGGNPLRQLNFPRVGDCHVLVTDALVEQLAPVSAAGPRIDLDSVNALNGIDLLVTGGNGKPQRYQAAKTMVVAPGSALRSAPEGGFAKVVLARGGVQEIRFESGIGQPVAEVLVPASLLESVDAHAEIRSMIDESAIAATELVMRVYGRATPAALRAAGLASLCEYGRSLTASFELDVSGLLTVQDASEAGRGPLPVLEEIESMLGQDGADNWDGDREHSASIAELKGLLAGAPVRPPR